MLTHKPGISTPGGERPGLGLARGNVTPKPALHRCVTNTSLCEEQGWALGARRPEAVTHRGPALEAQCAEGQRTASVNVAGMCDQTQLGGAARNPQDNCSDPPAGCGSALLPTPGRDWDRGPSAPPLPFGGQLSDLLFQTCKLYPAYPLLRPYPGETREDLHKNIPIR